MSRPVLQELSGQGNMYILIYKYPLFLFHLLQHIQFPLFKQIISLVHISLKSFLVTLGMLYGYPLQGKEHRQSHLKIVEDLKVL